MRSLRAVFLVAALFPATVYAEVDKIYDPYVYQGELELEARGVHQFDDKNKHELKFAAGYGINAMWFLEGYAVFEQKTGGHAKLAELELENKLQLTDQGHYWADLGMLTEVSKEMGEDKWEVKAGPLLQKQIRRWVVTANLYLEKQFGRDRTSSKVQVLGAARLKYRLSQVLEPTLEYYADEETHSLGPVFMGATRWGKTPIKWEAGILAGLNHASPDISFRWLLEFEFY